jgi:hypothetical protein
VYTEHRVPTHVEDERVGLDPCEVVARRAVLVDQRTRIFQSEEIRGLHESIAPEGQASRHAQLTAKGLAVLQGRFSNRDGV